LRTHDQNRPELSLLSKIQPYIIRDAFRDDWFFLRTSATASLHRLDLAPARHPVYDFRADRCNGF